jgi:hypothetical protein
VIRWLIFLLLVLPSLAEAQHTRIYAVVAGNDDPANNMAGSSLGSGLWQSDDTGRTWKQLGWKHIKAFSMDHDSNGRVLYLAAGNGVLKSSDYGESWKVMTDWRVAEVMDVMILQEQPSVVLAATAHGVIKSVDAGQHWKPSHKGIKSTYVSRLSRMGDHVYACTENGLFSSTNEGESWKLVEGSPLAIRATASHDNNTMFIVGDSSFASVGYSGRMSEPANSPTALWTVVHSKVRGQIYVAGERGVGRFTVEIHPRLIYNGPRNVHALLSIGESIFAGTLGEGIWIEVDPTSEWRQIALPKSQVWTLKQVDVR